MPGTYLAENQVGFDTSLIGFPGLGSCMGFVMQTANGLFGFHIYGTNTVKTPSFNEFCQAHGSFGHVSHIYGSCNFGKRYGTAGRFVKWHEEMRSLATALGYSGPASGFDISSPSSGVTDVGSAYLEYAFNSGSNTVAIRYAHMDQIDAPKQADPTTAVKVIKPDLSRELPYLAKITVDATAKPGSSMTTVGNNGFYSVTL